jgi:hypothetical protein
VVVNCNRQFLLGGFLADDILIQVGLDFVRLGEGMTLNVSLDNLVIVNDVVADANTLVADEDSWPCDKLANVVLALVAKGTAQRLFTIISFQADSLPRRSSSHVTSIYDFL